MKKKIIILGSTGSIGKSTINIIKKNKDNFNVVLLTCNKNYHEIIKQTKLLKPKNLVIQNKKTFLKVKKKLTKSKIRIYDNLNLITKIIKKKVDYTICSISGLAGLQSTIDAIKISKTIAIANKESLICAWHLIDKNLKKFKTKFIPVDSEHFSIYELLNNSSKDSHVEQVIITASGGPFLNLSINKFKNITIKETLKHPNWSMGKKISVDSATMMNKVFEVIEAQRIFNINMKKIKILIHPKSYIHAIIKFSNGLSKILIHDTDMKIPIFNSIYPENNNSIKTKKLNIRYLNNLNLQEVDDNKFPSVKLLRLIPLKNSLFETVLVSCNDELVDLFLQKKISFLNIHKLTKKIISLKEFDKFKHKRPKNIQDILDLDTYVRLKTQNLSVEYN